MNPDLSPAKAPKREVNKTNAVPSNYFSELGVPFDVAQDMLCAFARVIVIQVSPIQNRKSKITGWVG
jgi:hypothetical protein